MSCSFAAARKSHGKVLSVPRFDRWNSPPPFSLKKFPKHKLIARAMIRMQLYPSPADNGGRRLTPAIDAVFSGNRFTTKM